MAVRDKSVAAGCRVKNAIIDVCIQNIYSLPHSLWRRARAVEGRAGAKQRKRNSFLGAVVAAAVAAAVVVANRKEICHLLLFV